MKPLFCPAFVIAALLPLAPLPAFAGHAGAESPSKPSSLCTAQERVLFTCPTGQKNISLCLAGGNTGQPHLVFVLGELGRPPDILVPYSRQHPWKQAFSYEQNHTNKQGGWVRLRVQPAGAGLVLYRNFHQGPMPYASAGVAVLDAPQRLLACTGPSFSDYAFAHLDEWPGLAAPLVRDFGILDLPPLSWVPCSKLTESLQATQCPGAFAPEF